MIKIICLILMAVVGILSGVLMYTVQAGRLPMTPPPEETSLATESVAEEAPKSPLISSQIGLVDELVESLQLAHEELKASKLRLDKREKNLQELYSTYLKLRQETGALLDELESRLVKVDDDEVNNFKKLSGVYSKMDPNSAAQSLKHMEAERVALILNQMDSRSMAAIMDSAVASGMDGSEYVAQWSDAMRRLNEGKDEA